MQFGKRKIKYEINSPQKHIEKISVDKDGFVTVRFINGAELTNKEEVEVCKKDQE